MNGNVKWVIGVIILVMTFVAGWLFTDIHALDAKVDDVYDKTVKIERYKGDINSLKQGQIAITRSIDSLKDIVYKLHSKP